MASSGILTVFGEPPRPERYPSAFVVSMLVHAGFFSLLTIRLIQTHHVIERFPPDRFQLRYVDFHSKEPKTRPAAGGGIRYAGTSEPSRADAHPRPKASTAGGGSAGSPTVARITPKRMPASQTLIQPDIAPNVTISNKTAVPLVVIWTPDKTNVVKVVPAFENKSSIAVVEPSLDTPIKEENISDLKLSSSAFVTQGPAVPPSTTSPVVVHSTGQVKQLPQTTSKQPEPPTPGRLISLSDLRVTEGKVAVPIANQTAKSNPGALIPGQLKDPAPTGNGSSETKTSGTGAGKGSGDHTGGKEDASPKAGTATDHPGTGDKASKTGQGAPGQGATDPKSKAPASANLGVQTVAKAAPTPAPSATGPGSTQDSGASAATQGGGEGNGEGNESSTVHISRPKDGQFGVVVFGSSVADQYPETAEMWSGRMASTVYLHVGLPKNWILQYALPRLAEGAGGGHLDAPWPFEISRPNLDPGDVGADAVILHGFVGKDGRFDQLEVVFPAKLAEAPTWVGALNRWQFRPAKQNGQAVPVEVLLIVPAQSE